VAITPAQLLSVPSARAFTMASGTCLRRAVMRSVLVFVDVRTLCRVAQARRAWRDAACGLGAAALWRERCATDWPYCIPLLGSEARGMATRRWSRESLTANTAALVPDARRLYRGLRRAQRVGWRVVQPWPPPRAIPRPQLVRCSAARLPVLAVGCGSAHVASSLVCTQSSVCVWC
jgi:hypothetical protein